MIFFILLPFSCSSGFEKNIDAPGISRDEMISILVDLSISAAMVESELLGTNPLIYQKKLGFYEDVFEKHCFTQEEVIRSFEIYSQDLKALDLMYDEVLEKLSKQEIELNETK